MEKTAFDPKRRRLCPDGACIGVIAPDGKCRECGRTDAGPAKSAGGSPDAATASPLAMVGADTPFDEHELGAESAGGDDNDNDDDSHGAGADAVGGEVMAGSVFNPKRRLCSDGSCLGVVGPTGECPVCGTPAEA
jgi:hypothetical protein